MPKETSEKSSVKVTWPQWIACVGVTLLVIQVGFMGAWSSPYIEQLTSPKSSIPITMTEVSWVVSLLNFGRLFGAIAGSLTVNYYGSKTTILVTSIPIALCWLFIIVADNVWWLYVSRFLSGLCLGMMYSCFSLYLAEVANPSIRGALVALAMSGLPIGNLVMSIMGAYLSMTVSAALCLLPCPVLMILFLWLPDSPHHLIKMKRYEKAKTSIRWYHRDCDVEVEFLSLQKFVDNISGKSFLETLGEFRTVQYRKSLFLVTILFMYSQMCGINNVFFYMETILKSARVTVIDPSQVVIIVMAAGILGSCVPTFLMDRFGRKFLMIASCAGIAIALASLTLAFHLVSHGFESRTLDGLMIFTMIFFFIAVFIGVLSVPPAILSELFPSHLKCIAACFGSCVAGVFSFISTITYLPLIDLMTDRYVYLFYGLLLLTAVPFTIFCVPETKGLSLQEIQTRLMKK
ncbi:PREDICTED: facilitated trehalose transporter Tret1-like [Dufourea novaeangliae]|uniref:facilitated trehalose transporter Tret1-like n=1 Tax=Dufourea novaeangliae TaxID=178035 RepID=UPI000766EB6C|nr:PREDICTED: facilitated trehalose transporter Tret1-like [Dufourea novaeangliae]